LRHSIAAQRRFDFVVARDVFDFIVVRDFDATAGAN